MNVSPNIRTIRRRFRQAAKAAFARAGLWKPISRLLNRGAEELPPVHQITRGPKHHWFGYYDKLEFDPTDRYVLGMEIDFEHSRRAGQRDPNRHGRSRPTGTVGSNSVRLVPGAGSKGACSNGGRAPQAKSFGTIVRTTVMSATLLDVNTRAKHTIEHPIYTVSPDGQWAVAPDFRRLGDTRPGYGYVGIPDPNRDVLAPNDTGIFRIDLTTGEQKLLFSVADIVRLPYPHGDLSKSKHWFNHLLINTDGSRFTFLHRWKAPGDQWHTTRMLTAAPDGSDIRVLVDSGWVSHFICATPSISWPTPK